jgi:vacuolar-type H+-ATPase subunit H
MKVLDLLDEIEEIVETSANMPLTNKIIVDKGEMLEIVSEIRQVLPDEIQQAQFIKNERARILDEAKHEYELLIRDAEKQAATLVETNAITVRAKQQGKEILSTAEENAKNLKMGTYEYMDKILYDFQEKMDYLNSQYFGEMFENLQNTFEGINDKLQENRNEIKEMAYKTKVEGEI